MSSYEEEVDETVLPERDLDNAAQFMEKLREESEHKGVEMKWSLLEVEISTLLVPKGNAPDGNRRRFLPIRRRKWDVSRRRSAAN